MQIKQTLMRICFFFSIDSKFMFWGEKKNWCRENGKWVDAGEGGTDKWWRVAEEERGIRCKRERTTSSAMRLPYTNTLWSFSLEQPNAAPIPIPIPLIFPLFLCSSLLSFPFPLVGWSLRWLVILLSRCCNLYDCIPSNSTTRTKDVLPLFIYLFIIII